MCAEALKHLNNIKDINSNKGVKFTHKAASPGSHCPMHTTLANLKGFGKISTLVVGMPECGYYSRFVMNSPKGKAGELHYTYIMDSNEVVFGCREGVKSAIKHMEEEGAHIIAIIVTCIPELIGEDIEAVIKELKGEVNSKIICYNVAHFKRNGYQAGFFNTMAKLVDTLEEPSSHEKEFSINILGSSSSKELKELERVMDKAGYAVNKLSFNTPYEAFVGAEKSRLNLVLSHKMEKFAQKLKEKYDTPYIKLHSCYDAKNIDVAYKNILNLLQIEEKFSFNIDFDELRNLEDKCKEKLKDLKYISTSAELDIIPLAEYLCTFSMKPILLHVEEFYDGNAVYVKKFDELGENPKVGYISDSTKLKELMEAISVDLSFGSSYETAAIEFLARDLNEIYGLQGYERSYALLQKLLRLTEDCKDKAL